MSLLLDDVSIVVTPNGYKAGTLYGVLPTYAEGSEDVVNGDFASGGTSWNTNTGWTITTGIATSVGATADINQGVWSPNAESQYQVTFEVKTITAGGVRFRFGGVFGATRTEVGVYTEIITTIDTERIRIASVSVDSSYFSGTITNISVKEVTSSDMDVTRATAATRVDEDGLVNYAEVLGSDLITNGDFNISGALVGNSYTLGWRSGDSGLTISNGVLNLYSDGSGFVGRAYATNGIDSYSNVLITGKTYEISYEVTENIDNSTLYAYMGAFIAIDKTVGIHTTYITATTDFFLFRNAGSDTTIKLDNVSVKEVYRDNVPRIDYTGGGCPHILAEPERTNLVEYSEDFSEWSIARATLGANITAPNGANDGYSIIATAVADDHYVSESISVVDTNIYTYSAYLKKGSKSWARLWNTLVGYVDFDLENGVVGTQSSAVGSIELFGDGWYRCSIVYTATSTGNNSHRIYTLDGDNHKVFLGDGSTINLYMFGAQLEEGSYATSYIPNSGTSAGVTRNQDIFTRDGIGSLINSTEGVLFAELSAFDNDVSYRYMGLTDGSADNRVIILYYSGVNTIRVLLSSGGTKYFDDTYAVTDITDFHKIAVKWKVNDFALWIDGFERATDTSGSAPIGLNTLALDQAGASFFFGKVKQLQVYDTALTDEQLLQLTGESGTDFYESYAEMAAALTYTIQ